MAKVLFTAAISEIRGSLNGSVFNKSRNGFTLGKKNIPRGTKSRAQLQIMAGFSAAAAEWGGLSNSIKTDWATIAAQYQIPDTFGNPTNLSPSAYFRKCQQWRYPAGEGLLPAPDTTPASPYEFILDAADLEVEEAGSVWSIKSLEITGEYLNPSPGTNFFKISISQDRTSDFSPYYGTYFDVGFVEVESGEQNGDTLNLTLENIRMPEGWRTRNGAIHIIQVQSLVIPNMAFSVEQLVSTQAIVPPSVEFPALTIGAGPFGEGLPVWDGFEWLAVPWFADFAPVSTPWSEFQIALSFGIPQEEESPIPPDIWGPERLQNWVGPFDTSWRASPGPLADPNNSGLVISAEAPPYNPATDVWLPTRIRLYHVPSGTYGPYNEATLGIQYA